MDKQTYKACKVAKRLTGDASIPNMDKNFMNLLLSVKKETKVIIIKAQRNAYSENIDETQKITIKELDRICVENDTHDMYVSRYKYEK